MYIYELIVPPYFITIRTFIFFYIGSMLVEVAKRDRHGDFNLCSPYGEHLEGKQQITIIDVSIHAPARGAL